MSFEAEVERAFRFLVAECGLTGPSPTDQLGLSYSGPGVTYTIVLDASSHTVTTSIARDLAGVRLLADLPALVFGAALGNSSAVACGARSFNELRMSLATQAAFVRRLQPYLTPLNVVPLMRAAHARELRSA
ncbi:hypothetical protein [Paractinoplanes ferrugineus]|uniref:hypothetical protein n=1 Tax=Paractinoplanes ferrugineus TaxID=113564 RepID=UPI001941993B|nr:hypothetical protein [Actinoplanes ferrugineus]